MSLLAENTKRWNVMHENSSRIADAREFANRALAQKPLYQRIAAMVKTQGGEIPWFVIPLIHERECIKGTRNLTCSIGQGSPFRVKSRIKPYNGPFNSFEEAAVYNLLHSPPFAARNKDWTAGGILTINEQYNGLWYAKHGRPSPYIWGATNQQVRGKFVRDGVYDPSVMDPQLGIAIMLRELMRADPTIHLDSDVPGQDKTDRTKEVVHGTTGVGGVAEASHQALINGVDDWIVYTIAAIALVALGYWVYRIYQKKKGEV